MPPSSAHSDYAQQLAQRGSCRTGSWASSDPLGSDCSTPRPPHSHSSHVSSSTSESSQYFTPSPLNFTSPVLPGGIQSPRDSSPTPAAHRLTSTFEKWNNDTFYRYKEEYNDAWMKWIDTRQEYKTWIEGLPR